MKIHKIRCVKCDTVFASLSEKENTCQQCQKQTPEFIEHYNEKMDEFYGRLRWR